MTQPCGATRAPVNDPGWTCDGQHLVIVLTDKEPLGVAGAPAVVREDLVWLLDKPTRGFIRRYGTRPFSGGDHVHLVIRED